MNYRITDESRVAPFRIMVFGALEDLPVVFLEAIDTDPWVERHGLLSHVCGYATDNPEGRSAVVAFAEEVADRAGSLWARAYFGGELIAMVEESLGD